MAKPDVNLIGNSYAERLLQTGKLRYLVTCSRYNSVLKSRNITLPTKVHIFKVMVFPGDTYSSENWTVKKAEHQRIGAFELWCWRILPLAQVEPLGVILDSFQLHVDSTGRP